MQRNGQHELPVLARHAKSMRLERCGNRSAPEYAIRLDLCSNRRGSAARHGLQRRDAEERRVIEHNTIARDAAQFRERRSPIRR